MNELSRIKRQWLVKHISNTAPVRQFMHRMKEWKIPTCPICFEAIESSSHVFTCKKKVVRKLWRKSFKDLIEQMDVSYSDPYICTIIMNRLLNWPWKNYNKFTYEDIPDEIRIEMESQDMIGWRPFIYGGSALTWQRSQNKWLIRVSTKCK